MAAKPKKAFTDLAEVVGSPPPAEFNDLKAEELNRLGELISESRDLHEASISAAEDGVIKLAPRPLRGTVRKMLGAD